MRSYLTEILKDITRFLILAGTGLLVGTVAYNHYFPRVSSIQRIKTLPLLGDVTRKTPELYKGVVILTDENGKGFCSGSVIDNNYIVTAAHCIVEGTGKLNSKTLNVRTNGGKLIQVNARAGAANTRVDVGLVVGDFRDFQFVPIDYKTMHDFQSTNPLLKMLQQFNNQEQPTTESSAAITCGYPEAQATLTCIPVRDLQYDTFQLIGQGQLFPGMSGGPVFVQTEDGPKLIAVNTAVTFDGSRNLIILSPVLGLQGEFDLY